VKCAASPRVGEHRRRRRHTRGDQRSRDRRRALNVREIQRRARLLDDARRAKALGKRPRRLRHRASIRHQPGRQIDVVHVGGVHDRAASAVVDSDRAAARVDRDAAREHHRRRAVPHALVRAPQAVDRAHPREPLNGPLRVAQQKELPGEHVVHSAVEARAHDAGCGRDRQRVEARHALVRVDEQPRRAHREVASLIAVQELGVDRVAGRSEARHPKRREARAARAALTRGARAAAGPAVRGVAVQVHARHRRAARGLPRRAHRPARARHAALPAWAPVAARAAVVRVAQRVGAHARRRAAQ
jgi:hypothetical protein